MTSPSGKIGKYKYYTSGDIRRSVGCGLCLNYLKRNYNEYLDFYWDSYMDLIEYACSKCPSYQAVLMLEEYAEKLNTYDRICKDDGK